MLSEKQIQEFRRTGHLTVTGVFDVSQVQAALDDIDQWGREFLAQLSPQDETWYLEKADVGQTRLRKLDNPACHRSLLRKLGTEHPLIEMVGDLMGPVDSVFFSQVFMKPPEGGGPKPIHQDNFYFGPSDPNGTLTAWVALDDATIDNGCLYYTDRAYDEIIPHVAPPDEPFNLQIPPEHAAGLAMSPAPVPAGGVSFHHGNTPHQSSANQSDRPRRAIAFHYLASGVTLTHPALPYDDAVRVRVNADHDSID